MPRIVTVWHPAVRHTGLHSISIPYRGGSDCEACEMVQLETEAWREHIERAAQSNSVLWAYLRHCEGMGIDWQTTTELSIMGLLQQVKALEKLLNNMHATSLTHCRPIPPRPVKP